MMLVSPTILAQIISLLPGLPARDVPLAKNPSTGTAQQRLFLVLKVVLHAVVVISEVLLLSTKSRCSRCCRHISTPCNGFPPATAATIGVRKVVLV